MDTQSKSLFGHSLSAVQLVESLQFPHILLQGWMLIKIIQHVTAQTLEGNVHFSFCPCHTHFKFPSHPASTLFPLRVSYLHEQFDMFVFSQEVFAESHPLWYHVQNFSFPLQSLLPVLFPCVSLCAIGGIGLRLQHRWSDQMQYTISCRGREPMCVMFI